MGLKFARIATATAATLLVVGGVASPAYAATWTGPEQITTAAGDIAPGQLLTTATGSVLPYLVQGSSALLSSVYYRRHTLSGFQAPQLLASDALSDVVDFPAWTADDNTVRSLITVGPINTETLRYVQDTNGTLVQQDLGTGSSPALATDPAGSSMAVYAGAQGLLSRVISSAGVASPAVVVDPSTDRPDGVAALGNGEFLAVFSGRNVGTEHPRYAVYSSGAWSTPADVPDTSANYIYGTLQGTPDGRVVLLNSDSVQNGSYSHVYEAGQWGPSVTVTTATGGNSGPAVTPDGTTYVVADQLYSLAPHATSWVISGPAAPRGGSSFCQGDGSGGMGFDAATSTLRVMHVLGTNTGCDLVDFSLQLQATAPAAPTGVNAAPGNAQAVVSWTAPASDGGSAVTGYTVTATPGGRTAATTGATTAAVTGLTNGTSYTFTVTATNLAGTSAASAPSPAVTPVSGSFTVLPTARVFDGTATTVPRLVQIAGLGGVPANATSVVVNTEVFNPTAAGYVRVTPAGLDPGVAVQEFARGQTISNLVVVKLVGGKIQVKVSAGSARILMDVSGYYSDGAGASFTGLPTARVFDGAATTAPRLVQIAGLGGVPADATAVVVNTEVFNPSAAGYVRVTPAGLDAGVAVQEFTQGQTISNLVVVKLVGGKIQVKVSAGSARILMDVSGYYGAGAGASFTGLPTARVFDGTATTVPRLVQIAGLAGVPADATSVVVNTEVFNPTAAGYVRVTPAGLDPGVAVQEFARGQTISNLVVVKLVGGKIQVKVSAGSARILMDISGYYSPGAP